MSFQNIPLETRVNIFVKLYNEIKSSISNIPDENTLKELNSNFSNLITSMTIIKGQFDIGNNPNADSLRNKYDQTAKDFNANKSTWENILKEEEAKYKKIHDQEDQKAHESHMPNIFNEQLQQTQQSDGLDYMNHQMIDIKKKQEEINEITHILNDKILEDHPIIVKIDDNVENAKDNMAKGNKELDEAEKDQKKCNIC